jgi:hypothetical protein
LFFDQVDEELIDHNDEWWVMMMMMMIQVLLSADEWLNVTIVEIQMIVNMIW